MKPKNIKFIDCLENCKYRYIDQTGLGRPAVSSNTPRPDLNLQGYEAYQTVNGFLDASDNKKDQCINLNAFFVDIDGRKDPEELKSIIDKLEPSFIIETGAGYHIYYLLDEPIYRDEITPEEWAKEVERWERIEQSVVTILKGDPVVRDVTRIMRQVDTFYWKKTGEKYKDGTDGVFKIKGVHKNLACRYSMNKMEEIFPTHDEIISYENNMQPEKVAKYADAEKKDFFNRVNEKYPIEERPSFQRLISGEPGTLPKGEGQRNHALLITATLMRQAGWSKAKALKNIESTGWHGIEKENGGKQEIVNTINSAYNTGYTYSYKNEIIAHNMSDEEQMKIQQAYTVVAKERKETDKVRFSTYEREILAQYPYLKKNEIGIVFNYDNGVYRMLSDQEVSDIILNGLYEDMLWSYRTKKNVSDKVACLISIIPDLKITNDGGYIMNLKNGLLNIYTRELLPHTPNYVSLIQSPVMYLPFEKAPIWEECLEAWMAGPEKEDKTLLLQQYAGYCLSSSMQYDRALFLIGDGGNGKSTFVDTIARVIGTEATSHIDLESLYSQFGLAGLIGKRLNIIEEVHGNYYQSNKLKKLISGEKITIDIKYKPQFSFRPQAKFVFAVNQMPRVDDTSTATERRICAVNFKNNFRDNPNVQLRSDIGLLAQELPGILNWMLDGAQKLRDMKNFVKTVEQTLILSEYRQENSSVEGFIMECLEFTEGQVMSAREMYDQYKAFCHRDGRKFKSSAIFVREVKAFGARHGKFTFHERENGHDISKFEGVCVNDSWKQTNPSLSDW